MNGDSFCFGFFSVCDYGEQQLTHAPRSHLGWGVALVKGPAAALATVERPFVEVKVAERRLNAAPLEGQEIFIWSDVADEKSKMGVLKTDCPGKVRSSKQEQSMQPA